MPVDKLFVAMKAFIVNHEGKVLLLQEGGSYRDGTNAGKWDVPGGRLNPGEHFYDGIIREVKEETGLDVELGRPFFVGEWFPQVRGEQWHIVATFMVCKTASSDVTLSEDHAGFQWIDPQTFIQINNCTTGTQDAFKAYLALEA